MAPGRDLEGRITQALKEAMKARDAERVRALRNIRARLQNRAIEKRAALDDSEVIQVLMGLAKQRRESIEQFRAGGREDLAAREEAELRVIQEFLPEPLDENTLRRIVAEAVREAGASGLRDMGRVMGVIMPRVRGRADGRTVQEIVRAVLAGESD